jgi:hypothetical protein
VLPPEELVAVIAAVCFAAGLNVYATGAALGLLARAQFVVLPEPLAVLADGWVVGAFGALFAIEFVADKIPGVDLVWNLLHTVVRVPAGALLAWSVATPLSPTGQVLAALGGALLSLAALGGKLALRTAVTPSPEPLSNIALSLIEDTVAIGLVWFATQYPFVAAGIVVLLLVLVAVAMRLVVRALRWSFGRRVRSSGGAGP